MDARIQQLVAENAALKTENTALKTENTKLMGVAEQAVFGAIQTLKAAGEWSVPMHYAHALDELFANWQHINALRSRQVRTTHDGQESFGARTSAPSWMADGWRALHDPRIYDTGAATGREHGSELDWRVLNASPRTVKLRSLVVELYLTAGCMAATPVC